MFYCALCTNIRDDEYNECESDSATGDEHKELMRKDIIDLKRTMNDEIHEKEATQKAAIDLRNMVKKAEGEKIELNRSLLDAGQKIAGMWVQLEHGVI